MARRPAVGLIGTAVLFALVSAASAQTRDRFGREIEFDPRYYDEEERTPEPGGGQKMCSVYVPDRWRDTISVPENWTWRDCRNFALSVGASHVHLICVFERGEPKMSMGGPGEAPEPDCGWGRRRR